MEKIYKLSKEQHEEIAKVLYDTDLSNTAIPLLTEAYPDITVDDAYAIQQEGLKLRMADGHRVVGRKIGITSKGMMEMLKCDTPDYGYLLDGFEVDDSNTLVANKMNIPMVEGEIAFIFEEDLPNRELTEEDIIKINPFVVPCFEICDARYPSWKVTVKDTISDNAGASRYLLGKDKKRLSDIDPVNIKMVITKNGSLYGEGQGKEVMGSPIKSITWLANKLLNYGTHIKAGDVVLSGSFLKADLSKSGDNYTVSLEGFDTISLSFK